MLRTKKRNPRLSKRTKNQTSTNLLGFVAPSSGLMHRNCNEQTEETSRGLLAPSRRCFLSKSRGITVGMVTEAASKHSRRKEELAAMVDYTLPAIKVHISQLKPAKPAKELRPSGEVAFTLGSLIFQRAWLQGTLVQGVEKASLALKDETGVLPIQLGTGESGTPGTYVLVVGAYFLGADGSPFLLVHKIVDLSLSPHRDEFWRLEVTEAHKLFYDKLMNAPTR